MGGWSGWNGGRGGQCEESMTINTMVLAEISWVLQIRTCVKE
jgi:hypothetical protein